MARATGRDPHDPPGPRAGREPLNLSTAVVLGGVAVDGWLLGLVAIRGRRPWLQATFAACALSFLVAGASFVGRNEGLLPPVREDVVLGLLLLSHALTAILVLGLIHGEALPRQRAITFLLLAPVPLLATLAPAEGWTVATAYEGNVLGGFLVLCLGIALAETIYARRASPMFAAHAFWMGVGVVSLIVAGPVYVYGLEALSGRATLLVGRGSPQMTPSGIGAATVPADRQAALRTMTTAAEFLGSSPGDLLVLEDLADLAALSGWKPVLEVVIRLRHLARDTGSTVVLCPSRLTESERKGLKDLDLTWWTLPDPATELVAILKQSFGTGAVRLFDAFCRAYGLRPDDVTTDHVPAFEAFLARALRELSGAVGGPAAHGLRAQYEAAASVLRSFAAQAAVDLARGKRPARRAADTTVAFVVTAADYWKGKEMEELFAAADSLSEPEPLFERARTVFVEQLGDAGEGVLRTQLARLGKKPEDLSKGDLVRIADRAAVDLSSLADVVDLPQEKDRIHRQIESIRQKLVLIAEGTE